MDNLLTESEIKSRRFQTSTLPPTFGDENSHLEKTVQRICKDISEAQHKKDIEWINSHSELCDDAETDKKLLCIKMEDWEKFKNVL